MTLPYLPLFIDCPPGIPLVQCDGDPCRDAVCPSHPTAVCRADYCGGCTAKWFIGDEQVTCTGMYAAKQLGIISTNYRTILSPSFYQK